MKKLNVRAINKEASRHSVMEYVVSKKSFIDLFTKKGVLDEQTRDLLEAVYYTLAEKLELSDSEKGALNKLMTSIERGSKMSGEMHRNNIFKAADLLGLDLPSAMF